MEKKFAGRITLILSVLFLALLGIFPPGRLFNPDIPLLKKHNLKPGIDISGGTSLLYEIKAPEGVSSDDLAQRVADALKKRVDPEGVRNLIWRPQGANRLEIQMPLTEGAAAAGKAREDFSRAQEQLERTNIRVSRVRAALALKDPAVREARLAELAMGSQARRDLFAKLDKAMQDLAAAEQANDAIRKVDANDEIARIEQQIEATNLPVAQLQTKLELLQATIDKAQKSRKTDLLEQRRKERDAEVAQLKQVDFSARQKAVEEFVAAFDAYNRVRSSVDDAEGLKRLLRGSGVLEFHILVTDPQLIESMAQRLKSEGPVFKSGDTMRWFEVERPDQLQGRSLFDYADKKWVLAYVTPDKSMVHQEGAKRWGLERAYPDYDPRSGEQVVAFRFDAQGAMLFGELSGAHVGQPLAIVLDDRIISAPNLLQRIEGNGQISGSYTPAELDYLVRTLNAGSLPARLEENPISERTVSPALGKDNLRRGFAASIVGLVVVAAFLIGYYYLSGVVATIAVFVNLVIILGAMAAFGATFTLPGIAAFVLTIGMAVDANVLIFERLREEQHRGLSLRMAIRNAYDRAFSAILDSNVTTAITSLILYWFGSEEVRGFGLTLLIGMMSSLFTALFVTRTIFDVMLERWGVQKLGSLPLTYPNWDHLLRPNIDWMSKAWVFYAFSTVFIVVGLSAFVIKGRDMFDVEFVKGTAVQVDLKRDVPIEEMRNLLAPYDREGQLPSAAPVSIGNSLREYEIVTPNHEAETVKNAIMLSLGDVLAIDVPSTFAAHDQQYDALGAASPVVQPVVAGAGQPLTIKGLDWVPASIDTHEAGVAVVLKDLQPPISAIEIANRIDRARLRDNLPFRKMNVETNAPADRPVQLAVVLISDPDVRYDAESPEKVDRWAQELARPTWNLVRSAVSDPPALQKVTNFNPQVARATLGDAIIALVLSIVLIMIYIWLRFGNLMYGSATVVALLHDTLITLGAVGIAHFVAGTFIGDLLLIDAFRMNLTLLAAVLTVMGYSMNDTVVVFDRIRENRGKFGHVNKQLINDSINQTLSRTLLTGGTTIVTVFVMYVFGGPGIHGFTFALLVGIVVGTYSSIAIAAPILLLGGREATVAREAKVPVGQLQRAAR